MINLEDPQDRSLVEKIFREGQEHVFRFWNELSYHSRVKFLNQLREIDFPLLRELRGKCLKKEPPAAKLEPIKAIPIPKTEAQQEAANRAKKIGKKLVREGRIGAFLVAGGQATRLGFDGPKGIYPIGPVSGKSLFQMHAEKILAESRYYGVRIPWYIMTSETNDEATRKFFQDEKFFGLPEEDIFFMKQRMLPALDEKGKLILDKKDHIFVGPNGHGGALLAMVESGAVDDMHRRGIEILSYFQVDNVLIKIIDPVFIGYHFQAKAEMSSKMLKKRDPFEKLGVFGKIDGKLRVIEYSDLKPEDAKAQNPDGSLKYSAGSIAVHLINVSFVESEVRGGFKFPYHVAHKKIPYLSDKGETVFPEKPNGYKFETFIFDALSDTTNSVIMEVVREEEFSPVKNREGEDSPKTAKKDLSNYFGRWLEVCGIYVPKDKNGNVEGAIEISPLFARDLKEFLEKRPDNLVFDGSLYLGP